MATVSTRATITGCDSNHCSAAAPPCQRFSNLPLWLRPRLTALLLPSKTGVASPFCYRSTRSWVVEPSGSPGLHAPSAPICSLRGRLAGLIPLLQATSSTTSHLAGLPWPRLLAGSTCCYSTGLRFLLSQERSSPPPLPWLASSHCIPLRP